jgi:hypothetical protein
LRDFRVVIIVVNNIVIVVNIIIVFHSLCERRLMTLVVYLSVKAIRCEELLAGAQLFPYSGVILGLVCF